MSRIVTKFEPSDVSDDQWAHIERIRHAAKYHEPTVQYSDGWIAANTREVLWDLCKVRPRHVICVSSPLEARLLSCILSGGDSSLDSRLHQSLNSGLVESLDSSLGSLYSSLDSGLHSDLDSSLRSLDSGLRKSLHSSLGSLHSSLGSLHWSLDSSLDSSLGSSLDSRLHQSQHSLNSSLDSGLRSLDWSLRSGLYSSLNSLHSSLGSLYSSLDSRLRSLDSSLHSSLNASLNENLGSAKPLRCYCGYYWTVWSAWYRGAHVLGCEFERGKLEVLQRFTRYCPVLIFDDENVFVLRPPRSVSWDRDEERLHNDSGPSVDFSNWFRLWHIHGVQVDEQIVMAPETQTIEQIESEKNNDVKSVRIERFGWPRYIKESGAQLIDQHENAIEGTLEQLYECGGQKKLLATCPSGKGRIVSLSVPPGINTCDSAREWFAGDLTGPIVGRT